MRRCPHESGGISFHGIYPRRGAGADVDVPRDIGRADSCGPHGADSRFVALGRDKLSEIDVNLTGTPGFQNEGDNEPTGLHVSAGGTTAATMMGNLADLNHARAFFTQQHGENTLWEIVKKNNNAGKKR